MNIISKSLEELIVEYQKTSILKPKSTYDDVMGCGNDGDVWDAGYDTGVFDAETDVKPLINALIAEREALRELCMRARTHLKACGSRNQYTDMMIEEIADFLHNPKPKP